MPPLASFMIEISKTQPLGNSKVHEIGSPDGTVGCDVGGQNSLNLCADHLVFLCSLQRILCPAGEACGDTVHLEKGRKKEENVGKPRNYIIYLFV